MPVKCHYLCARALGTLSKGCYWGVSSAGSLLPIQCIALWFLLNPLNIVYCEGATSILISWQILICCLANWQGRQNKKLLSMCFRCWAMAALIRGFFGLPSLMIYLQSARYCSFFNLSEVSLKDSEAISQGNGGTSRQTVLLSKLCFLWGPDLKNSCAIFFLKQAYTFSIKSEILVARNW